MAVLHLKQELTELCSAPPFFFNHVYSHMRVRNSWRVGPQIVTTTYLDVNVLRRPPQLLHQGKGVCPIRVYSVKNRAIVRNRPIVRPPENRYYFYIVCDQIGEEVVYLETIWRLFGDLEKIVFSYFRL